MSKIDIAGLKIDALTKAQLLDAITARTKTGQKTFLTTAYSEFLYQGLKDSKVLEMLNQADIAVADGMGIFWADKFLSTPLTFKNYWLKILQAIWQAFWTLSLIIFKPSALKKTIPEKIVGADLIWDLAKLSSENNFSIYLLGGFGNTPELTGQALRDKYQGLRIAGVSNKNPGDDSIIDDIKKVSPDFLFVAFGPIKQEKWIMENLPNLPVKLAVGLGGTFDYIAGKRLTPPHFLRYTGLEWLWRLITQPKRIKRIWQATFGLVMMLVKYKVFNSLGYRKNVVSVILDSTNQILIGKRGPKDKYLKDVGEYEKVKFQNYWQLPQGGVDEQEDIITAAQRETFEELGIKNINYLKTSSRKNFYSWNAPLRPLWFNKYHFVGQEQSIVYFKFQGSDSDIKIDNNEFENFQWVTVNDLDKKVHHERLALAKIVQEDLKEMQEKGILKKSQILNPKS